VPRRFADPQTTPPPSRVASIFERRAGRGAKQCRRALRPLARIAFDDGWRSLDELPRSRPRAGRRHRKIITRNQSPTSAFGSLDQSLSRCEHARLLFRASTHAYLGLSPGLDFESKLFVKPDAPSFSKKNFPPRLRPEGDRDCTNTDPYQPSSAATR